MGTMLELRIKLNRVWSEVCFHFLTDFKKGVGFFMSVIYSTGRTDFDNTYFFKAGASRVVSFKFGPIL